MALVGLSLMATLSWARELQLPAGQSATLWEPALVLAGLEAGDADAPIQVVDLGATWILRVTDEQGATREVEVGVPRTEAEREGVALLASSLLASGPQLTAPEPEAEPEPPPSPKPPEPVVEREPEPDPVAEPEPTPPPRRPRRERAPPSSQPLAIPPSSPEPPPPGSRPLAEAEEPEEAWAPLPPSPPPAPEPVVTVAEPAVRATPASKPPFQPRGPRPYLAASLGSVFRAPFATAPGVGVEAGWDFGGRVALYAGAEAHAPSPAYAFEPDSWAGATDGLTGVRWALDRAGTAWLGLGGGVRRFDAPQGDAINLDKRYEPTAHVEIRHRLALRRWLVLAPFARIVGEIPIHGYDSSRARVPVTVRLGVTIVAMRNGGLGLQGPFEKTRNSRDRSDADDARP